MSNAVRPVPGSPRPYNFPSLQHAALSNGVRIVVAHMPRLPLVTVLGLTDSGAALDNPGLEGVASLTALAVSEGTSSRGAIEVIEKFESLGTGLQSYADWDSSVMRFTAMPSRLRESFALFTEILREPLFPEREIVRLRNERLSDLEQRLAEPRGLADQRFAGFLYRSDSRFARSVGGTLSTVPRISREAVQKFHSEHYSPMTTTLIFVGDIVLDDAVELANSCLADWNGSGTRERVDVLATAREPERRVVIVAKEDAPQSELRVGHVGVPRSHPDYMSIVVMNAILGGLFSSRINLNLREKHAFTYGASSGFDWRRGAGPFVVSTAVKTEVTSRAVEEIMKEIDSMRAAAPLASELSLATDYLAGVFPIRFESTDAVAGAIASALINELPGDWFSTYRDRVREVTVEDVHRAAVNHVDPSRLMVLAVGDPATIEEPLKNLGLGDVVVVPAELDPAEGE